MLKLGLIGGGAMLLPAELQRPGSAAPISPKTQFQMPLHLPPVLSPVHSDATTDYYEIVVKQTQVEILPGLSTTIWGYNGQFPGPTIKARVGRQTAIRQSNHLPEPIVVHNHGMASKAKYDGYPDDIISPGGTKNYIYPNDYAATFWLHDHTMHTTGIHLYKGLASFYIVGDEFEDSLPLPKGEYDVPLLIQDRLFASNGELIYNTRNHRGAKGNIILVNGVPWPYFQVTNRKYRFRILNGSNGRSYRLALSSGQPLTVVGTDAGLISAPVKTNKLQLTMAERYEVIIDFSVYPIGTQVVLQNLAGETPELREIMRFDIMRQERDDSTIPTALRAVEPIPESRAVRTRDLTFSQNPEGVWTINGKQWDSNRVDATMNLGDIEIWRFINNSKDTPHPVHLHLVDFQILDRNGKPPLPYEVGWKDTVNLGPKEAIRVIAKFGPHRGKYVMHCHNLEHEDDMMMTQFQVL